MMSSELFAKSIAIRLWNRYALYCGLVVLLVWLAVAFSNSQFARQSSFYLKHETDQQRLQLQAHIYSLENMADIIFRQVINKEDILALMARASRSTGEELDLLRGQLLDKVNPAYQNIWGYGVRQLHFHLPDSISFLRFHRPARYGDSLKGVRHSIDLVNESRKPVKGFEEGRIFYGFRNVYPLFFHDEFVGTVEISYSFLALRKMAVRVFPAIYSLMMHKDVVGEAVWDEERQRYWECDISDFYYKDMNVVKDVQEELPSLNIVSFESLRKINRSLNPQVAGRLRHNEAFSVFREVPDESRMLVITFLPIRNVAGKPVAYFTCYRSDPDLASFVKRFRVVRLFVLAGGGVMLVAGLVILRQSAMKEKFRSLATTDNLTGVANRLHFELILDQLMRESKRQNTVFSLVLLDIDDFKKINDLHGHDAGDEVLKSMAGILRSGVRGQDFVARWGGEEFALILPGTTAEQACHVADKLRCVMAATPIPINQKEIRVTCSFGVTNYHPPLRKEELFHQADSALYKAKSSGKNCVVSFLQT